VKVSVVVFLMLLMDGIHVLVMYYVRICVYPRFTCNTDRPW